MKTIKTQITINALPEQIWKVFTDFESYPQWNPFCKKIWGNPLKQEVFIALDFTGPEFFIPYFMRTVHTDYPFRIIYKGLQSEVFGFIFGNEHEYIISPTGEKEMEFSHILRITGLVGDLLPELVTKDITAIHEKMNEDLKKRIYFKYNINTG